MNILEKDHYCPEVGSGYLLIYWLRNRHFFQFAIENCKKTDIS